jgi:hypothetical protein
MERGGHGAQERQRKVQKRTKGENRRMSQWEKSLGILKSFGKRSQWEEENIFGLQEFGEMTEKKWRERHDWMEVGVMNFEMEEFEKNGERSREERDDWKRTEMGCESWRQRRRNWRVKGREMRRLGFGRLKGGKGGFGGGGWGGVRPG